MITAEQVKSAYKDNPEGTSKALADSLRDFGYSSVTDDWVKVEIDRLLNSEEPTGGPSMFLKTWLDGGID